MKNLVPEVYAKNKVFLPFSLLNLTPNRGYFARNGITKMCCFQI